jgi:hypothetical protein
MFSPGTCEIVTSRYPALKILYVWYRTITESTGGTIRAAGAPSTTEQPLRAAKSARWNGLTYDTKGEIIIIVEWIAGLLANLTLFSPFLRIHSSFIIGSCLLRIRNP